MTATSPPSPSRHARRLAISVVCAGALAMAGTSTLAVAHGTRPAESVAAVSVVGLREGDTGPTVLAVQQKLIGFGYFVAGGADGHFGPGTTAALRVFQQQNGLNPTGVVTENTARYLGLSGGVAAGTAPSAATTAAPAALAAPTGSVVGLRLGMSGAKVRQLQLAIVATGLYLAGGADGTFGPSTRRGVTLVQRVNGLPETGVVDAATARVLGLTGSASSPSATPAPAGTVVQLGASGAAVKRVQQLLIKAGVTVVGGADGVFGPQTRRAVSAFQRLHGLSQTGTVDAATDAALVKASSGAVGRAEHLVVRRTAGRFDRSRRHQAPTGDHGHRPRRPRRRRRNLRSAHAQRGAPLPTGQRPPADRHRRPGDGAACSACSPGAPPSGGGATATGFARVRRTRTHASSPSSGRCCEPASASRAAPTGSSGRRPPAR